MAAIFTVCLCTANSGEWTAAKTQFAILFGDRFSLA
jgi:hypothetical protein